MQTDIGGATDNSISTLTATKGITTIDNFLTFRGIGNITYCSTFTNKDIGIGFCTKTIGFHKIGIFITIWNIKAIVNIVWTYSQV